MSKKPKHRFPFLVLAKKSFGKAENENGYGFKADLCRFSDREKERSVHGECNSPKPKSIIYQ